MPPWCESILGLKVDAVQGKQVSLEWTETCGGLGNGGTNLEFLSPFLWRAPPLEMRRESWVPVASVRNPAHDKVMRKEADIRKACSDFRGQGPGPGVRGQGPGASFSGQLLELVSRPGFLGLWLPPCLFLSFFFSPFPSLCSLL